MMFTTTLPTNFFGANFNPKHGYKNVNKKSRTAVDSGTESLCITFRTRSKTANNIPTHTVSLGNGFGFIWFYRISTIVVRLIPNRVYTYILNIYLVWFYGISTILIHLIPNPVLYIYIKYMICNPILLITL